MNKKAKITLFSSIGIVTAIVAPIAVAFAATPKQAEVTVSNINTLANTQEPAFERAKQNDPKSLNKKTILITAGGVVNDLSFNQSVWEALQTVQKQTGLEQNFSFAETSAGTSAQLQTQYDNALFYNYQYWVLTGFQQATAFTSWLQNGNNRQLFIDKKIVVIAVDWTLTNANFQVDTSLAPPGQFLSINYKTQEASWIVGYAAAKFISNNFDNNRTFTSFGGGPFAGVTNYNAGFLTGVLAFDRKHPNKAVKFAGGNRINLSTGFNSSRPGINSTINSIVGTGAQITFPVAGTLTSTTVSSIINRDQDQMIVGVDTNQSIAFPREAGIFFSSVEKNLTATVYSALAGLYLNNIQNNTFFWTDPISATDSSPAVPPQAFIPLSLAEATGLKPQNVNLDKGIVPEDQQSSENISFVGFAQSSLSGDFKSGINIGKSRKSVANEDLKEARLLFDKDKLLILASIPNQNNAPLAGPPSFNGGPQSSLDFLISEINKI